MKYSKRYPFTNTVYSRVLTRVTIQKIRFFTVSNSNKLLFFRNKTFLFVVRISWNFVRIHKIPNHESSQNFSSLGQLLFFRDVVLLATIGYVNKKLYLLCIYFSSNMLSFKLVTVYQIAKILDFGFWILDFGFFILKKKSTPSNWINLYFSFQQKENTMTFSSGGQEQTFSSASDSKFQETTATKTQQSTNFASSEFTGNIFITSLCTGNPRLINCKAPKH